MKDYLVSWKIGVMADSAKEAATKALAIQRDNYQTNIATIFKVTHVLPPNAEPWERQVHEIIDLSGG